MISSIEVTENQNVFLTYSKYLVFSFQYFEKKLGEEKEDVLVLDVHWILHLYTFS